MKAKKRICMRLGTDDYHSVEVFAKKRQDAEDEITAEGGTVSYVTRCTDGWFKAEGRIPPGTKEETEKLERNGWGWGKQV